MNKIVRCKKGVCGAAGGSWAGQMFMAWMQGECKKEDFHLKLDVEDDFIGMLVTWEGEIKLYNRYLIPEIITDKFHAIGSGSKIALPMMDAGHSALDSVKWACKYDLYSGGEIHALSLE
jgi:hypothetical protein